jgi:hypothetical protein
MNPMAPRSAAAFAACAAGLLVSRGTAAAQHASLTALASALASVHAPAAWCDSGRAAQVAVACISVQLRATARAELLMRRTALGDTVPSQLDATNPNWWTQQVSNTAASVFWPHRRLLPGKAGTGLVLLNPGELSGELKDPDDPWGYSHPRWCVLILCSHSHPCASRVRMRMCCSLMTLA